MTPRSYIPARHRPDPDDGPNGYDVIRLPCAGCGDPVDTYYRDRHDVVICEKCHRCIDCGKKLGGLQCPNCEEWFCDKCFGPNPICNWCKETNPCQATA